jgi:uncharacterized membrane protein YbhN (UPF0104 family)
VILVAAIGVWTSMERHGLFPQIRRHRRAALATLATVLVFAALVFVLAARRGQFETAILHAPIWLLLIAAMLHLVSLITRSEAWHFCMQAAGGRASRRLVYRAAGVGALASVVSAQLGVATRIGALRRAAPQACPRVPVLLGAELPIIAVEMMLAALFTFTLVGPLHLPVWAPLIVIAGALGAIGGLRRAARRLAFGPSVGLAALRELRGRGRLIALVVAGVVAQVIRNWLVLRAVGVDASIFSAIAILIVSVSLTPLPIGAGVGATATVLILGAHGLSATAAGGVLLTVTGTVGALCYAGWAGADHALAMLRPQHSSATATASPQLPSAAPA